MSGSGELWLQTATLLVAEGRSVAASIHAQLPLHDRIRDLMNSGVKLCFRSENYFILKRMRRRVLSGRKSDLLLEIEKFLHSVQPELVCDFDRKCLAEIAADADFAGTVRTESLRQSATKLSFHGGTGNGGI
jgi:hypothetical protein